MAHLSSNHHIFSTLYSISSFFTSIVFQSYTIIKLEVFKNKNQMDGEKREKENVDAILFHFKTSDPEEIIEMVNYLASVCTNPDLELNKRHYLVSFSSSSSNKTTKVSSSIPSTISLFIITPTYNYLVLHLLMLMLNNKHNM